MGLPECKECPENFNPRAPRGARQQRLVKSLTDIIFQSTRPSRGATLDVHVWNMLTGISIHAPLAGRDSCIVNEIHNNRYFNPRAPRGARPNISRRRHSRSLFQSTRPSRGATQLAKLLYDNQKISIHAPLAGRDSFCWSTRRIITNFNPRAPRGARLCRLARL